MQIKRYEVATLREARAAIKQDLGSEAVILSSKEIKVGGRKLIEVIAARDLAQVSRLSFDADVAGHNPQREPCLDQYEHIRRDLSYIKTQLSEIIHLAGLDSFTSASSLAGAGRKDLLPVEERQKSNPLWMNIYGLLTKAGISRPQSAEICQAFLDDHPQTDAFNGDDWKPQLREALTRQLLSITERTTDKRIKIFLGPSGAGKTTTLAKLAANFALDKKLKVGLITTDLFRIAAAEQLRVYAGILDLPLESAARQSEMAVALKRYADKDVILIDTPGRNYREENALASLGALLPPPAEAEVNLVLSLTASSENLLEAATRYDIIGYHNLILTKLDECSRFGFLYDFFHQTRKAVSYLTNGQNVPQDIVIANTSLLAKLIFEAKLN